MATREELEAQQEAEEEELEAKVKAHLAQVTASAGKGKKAKAAIDAAEREVEQWRYDLSVRHKEEIEELEEREQQGAEGSPAVGSGSAPAPQGSPSGGDDGEEKSKADEEAERAQRKKEKAQKKRQDRSRKEQEREEELERERREAGPSRRELELAEITTLLAKQKPRLRVHEVMGDGHCLYRAVADQLRRYRPEHRWAKSPDLAFEEIRALCAQGLQRRRDEYEPFAELKDGESFEAYCHRVRESADWGGHLELRALADELGGQILVYRAAEKDPLALGNSERVAPLRVTFHQYWLAAGEHYNSAVFLDDA